MRKSKTEQSGPDNPRPFGTSLDENGELLGGETSCRFGPLLSRGFSLTRPARSQSRRSYQNAPRGLFRRAVITVSQAATGLLALAMLMFTATLSAQRLVHAAARVQCGGAAGGGFEAHPLPAITSTLGRASPFGQTGQQQKSVQMVVALGVAYVVLGGLVFALAASFRLLSDKVDSFFAPLIPKPTALEA